MHKRLNHRLMMAGSVPAGTVAVGPQGRHAQLRYRSVGCFQTGSVGDGPHPGIGDTASGGVQEFNDLLRVCDVSLEQPDSGQVL
jgi:hypothetical protein